MFGTQWATGEADAADDPVAVARAALAAVRDLQMPASEAQLVDLLGVFEDLKSASAAGQARAASDLDVVARERQAAAGVPAESRGCGVASQVALARRESPNQGARHLGAAKALVREMPHTLRLLHEGRLSEWRATLLVRETACLTRADRGIVDTELCADPAVLAGLGDRALVARAKALAWRLDPGAARRRAGKAETERRVTLRPAPDVMANLTGLLPVAQGVAAYAALNKAADDARAAGDPRTRGQVMADTLVERVTGQSHAVGVPVEVQLVMTDRALLAGDQEPAHLIGYGPVPAEHARAILDPATDPAAETGTQADSSDAVGRRAAVWLRRLYTHPTTGELVGMDSRARRFPKALVRFLVIRDQTCRTPWCDAPVRHADHALSRSRGGPTSAGNGQGLCEACNYAKQAPGWSAGPAPGSRTSQHRVITVTPTGHSYESRPPPQPGWVEQSVSRLDVAFARVLAELPAA